MTVSVLVGALALASMTVLIVLVVEDMVARARERKRFDGFIHAAEHLAHVDEPEERERLIREVDQMRFPLREYATGATSRAQIRTALQEIRRKVQWSPPPGYRKIRLDE